MQECSEERYDEMLGVLPPALWLSKGFLVGEPFDHRTCKVTNVVRASYAAFFQEEALDISVLGRDVLNLFAVIVDRPANRVLLLHGADSYALQRT